MSIQTRHELQVTRGKLRRLEDKLAVLQGQSSANENLRELELQSLHKWINRLKEEIARFEARAACKS
jgi:uncharacterized small protein (DUF1192 family)